MKKLLNILLTLAVVLPTVTCLCVSVNAEILPVCTMDRPETCCCETEVKTPMPPSVQDFVAPGGISLPNLAVATGPVPVSAVGLSVSNQVNPSSLLFQAVPPQIYLQHQSFLI